jgi:serine/threonine protein kinase
LIFPWADGDLRSFWSAEKRYVGDPCIIPWLSEQCHELATAVAAIHEGYETPSDDYPGESQHVFGRHGDIKPTNILWFPHPQKDKEAKLANLGQLILGDFGLAAFHRRDSRSNLTSTNIPRSMTYSAPEFVTRETVSRATDIWALGCIFLEFVTWYLEGAHAVNEEFPEIRATADIFGIRSDTFFVVVGSLDDPRDGCISRVKPEVSAWCLRLSKNHNSSPYIRDFLALIHQMLDVEPKSRITGTDVAEKLLLYRRRCAMNAEYYQGKSSVVATSLGDEFSQSMQAKGASNNSHSVLLR